jgi:geranylgeranyl pyrophosphate synthase
MDACMSTHTDPRARLLQACETDLRRSTHQPGAHLNRLIAHHLDSGGGRTRAALALDAGLQLGVDEAVCLPLATACELIHNASLLLDDVQDQDTQRRGRAAAWLAFDRDSALCASTLMLSAAYGVLARMPNEMGHLVGQLVAHTHARTAALIHGQVLDLQHRQAPMDWAQYERIATQKSGSLLALPLELAMIAAQQTQALPAAKQAGERFALAYQISDDLHDLDGDRARGVLNGVPVLMASGLTQAQAVHAAAQHALAALAQARCFAADLPRSSGQVLAQMCGPLADQILSFNPMHCEQT